MHSVGFVWSTQTLLGWTALRIELQYQRKYVSVEGSWKIGVWTAICRHVLETQDLPRGLVSKCSRILIINHSSNHSISCLKSLLCSHIAWYISTSLSLIFLGKWILIWRDLAFRFFCLCSGSVSCTGQTKQWRYRLARAATLASHFLNLRVNHLCFQ